MPGGHSHRSGPLKQANKRNKRAKASKRSLTKAAGGKVSGRLGGGAVTGQQSKADRRNRATQIRRTKKEEMMRRKRGIDVASLTSHQLAPPKVVGILSLGDGGHELEERLRSVILGSANRKIHPHSDKDATVSVKYDTHKKDGHLTVLTCRTAFVHHYEEGENAALLAALDLARVCDLLVIAVDGNASRSQEGEEQILSMEIGGDDASVHTLKTNGTTASQRWDHLISEEGDRLLTAIKSQGLPTVLTVLAHTQKEAPDQMTVQSVKSLRRSAIKRRLDIKKYVTRFATTEFGNSNDRVIEVDLADHEEYLEENPEEIMDNETTSTSPAQQHTVSALIRTVCGMSARPSTWIANSPRNYVLTDSYSYDAGTQQMSLQGFVRGIAPLDVSSLIHVPCMGTFRCLSIRKSLSPLTPQHRLKNDTDMVDLSDENVLLADAGYQESTEMFATPDSLAGEQNLIGFDEAEEQEQEEDETFARPAGWSDYQAAWLDGIDEGENLDEIDHGELAAELNKKPADSAAADIDMMEANEFSEEERKALMEQRRKERNEDTEFPDEVQVDDDEKAQDRFARYRSMKSFRKSYWDPKENLPESYASLFHFSSFKATQRAIMNDRKDSMRAAVRASGNFFGKSPDQDDPAMSDSEDENYDPLEGCVPTGTYVTMILADVPEESFRLLSPRSIVNAVTLLSHENKMSVLHAGLNIPFAGGEHVESQPVKSKDALIFRCGWRTWTGRPVFSQNNLNCDKHKFERYRPDGFFAASWFGPVTYTPCPVLVFRKTPSNRLEIVASGSLMGADADRIIMKRIIMTGYPVKVRKRHAVVKYMFNNPEDVLWFKPAGLYTKHGLIGNIEASVGEHGTMKCLFHAPIKQHDTVCLPLYKRIFPKFAPVAGESTEESGTVATGQLPRLLVR
jgi:pre-rRNA-processing protein TSR1